MIHNFDIKRHVHVTTAYYNTKLLNTIIINIIIIKILIRSNYSHHITHNTNYSHHITHKSIVCNFTI